MRWVGKSTWILFRESLEEKNRKNATTEAQLLTSAQHFLEWQFSVTSVYSIFSPNGFCKGPTDLYQTLSQRAELLALRLCKNRCLLKNESFAREVWGQRLTKELSYTGGEAGRQSWLAGGRRTLLPPTTLQAEEALRTLIPAPRFNMIRSADATDPLLFVF